METGNKIKFKKEQQSANKIEQGNKEQSEVVEKWSRNINEHISDYLDRVNNGYGDTVRFGFPGLDDSTLGLDKGEFVVIGGRPAVGKSAFLLQIALNAAVEQKKCVGFISVENSCQRVVENAVFQRTGIAREKFHGVSKMEMYEWVMMEDKLKPVFGAQFFIDDTVDLDVNSLREKVQKLVEERGVEVIYIDCIQLIASSREYKGVREQEIGEVSRTIKSLARQYDIPIVATSRINRASITRTGGTGKPMLSDLRESGSIEHDADKVIFIHRPDFVGMSEDPKDRENVYLCVAKQRSGETVDVELKFSPYLFKFIDPEQSLEVPPV